MPGNQRHTTQAHPAYEPRSEDVVGRGWLLLTAGLLTAGLLLTALASLCLRSVCLPDVPGARESGFGVRHEQRGATWYHCEPWIRRALGG